MDRQEWRARLVRAAQAVIASRQRCYDNDEGASEAFDDVSRAGLDRLAAVLAERESD